MILAEMGPNAVIDCSSDLGSRNIDQTMIGMMPDNDTPIPTLLMLILL